MLYNWAAENPRRIACIAGIYPVCDFRSWPGVEKTAAAIVVLVAFLIVMNLSAVWLRSKLEKRF